MVVSRITEMVTVVTKIAPADGRRHAPMCVTEQLPDGRRQLVPEVSFSDMRQFT
jgi:hypothetical protein